jgi:hypothetical protein
MTANHSQLAGSGSTIRGRLCGFETTRCLVKVTVVKEDLPSSFLFLKILAEERRQEFRGNGPPRGLIRRVNDSRIVGATGEEIPDLEAC